uniref:8.9 kDa family member n=1 Tax=Rhipicephalus appendiculatus TaxID=34631 RepID=A0A131Z799_RHIAP
MMIPVILICSVLHLFLVFEIVPGQSVNTYKVNTTDEGQCHFNGTYYPNGNFSTWEPRCYMALCNTTARELTLVVCNARRIPGCLMPKAPKDGYPACCVEPIC